MLASVDSRHHLALCAANICSETCAEQVFVRGQGGCQGALLSMAVPFLRANIFPCTFPSGNQGNPSSKLPYVGLEQVMLQPP